MMAIRARFTVLVFGIALLFLLAACSSSQDTESENDDSGDGGSSQSQQSTSSSSASSVTVPDACDAFAAFGGLGGGLPGLGGLGGFSSSITGGPTVESSFSESPPSPEAEQIGDFFENVLEDALGDDVSADCYWELTTAEGDEEESGFLISYGLSSSPSSQVGQEIQNALTSAGATSIGSFGGGADADTTAMVMFGELPLNIAGDSGGMLIIQNNFAILFAGTGDDSGSSSSSSGLPSSSQPSQTLTIPPVPPASTDFQGIDDSLKADLENALDISLEVQSTFSSGNIHVVTYTIKGSDTVPSDSATRLTDLIIARGGTVTGTFTASEIVNLTFEDTQFDGISTSGNISIVGAQNSIAVSLQN